MGRGSGAGSPPRPHPTGHWPAGGAGEEHPPARAWERLPSAFLSPQDSGRNEQCRKGLRAASCLARLRSGETAPPWDWGMGVSLPWEAPMTNGCQLTHASCPPPSLPVTTLSSCELPRVGTEKAPPLPPLLRRWCSPGGKAEGFRKMCALWQFLSPFRALVLPSITWGTNPYLPGSG